MITSTEIASVHSMPGVVHGSEAQAVLGPLHAVEHDATGRGDSSLMVSVDLIFIIEVRWTTESRGVVGNRV